MAVILDKGGPQWYDYIAPVASELLGGVIKNQFDKSAEKRKFQMDQDTAAADQQRMFDRFNFARDAFGDGAFDIRNNPSQTAENYQLFNLLGASPETQKALIMTTGQPMQMSNTDLGDANLQSVLDTLSGNMTQARQGYGLNPTKVYEQDAATQREKMAQSAANYRSGLVANRPKEYAPQLVQDANGEYYWATPGQPSVPTGISGLPLTPPAPKINKIIPDEKGNNIAVYENSTSQDLGVRSPQKKGYGGDLENYANLDKKPTSSGIKWSDLWPGNWFGNEETIVPGMQDYETVSNDTLNPQGPPLDITREDFETEVNGLPNPMGFTSDDVFIKNAIANGYTTQQIQAMMRKRRGGK